MISSEVPQPPPGMALTNEEIRDALRLIAPQGLEPDPSFVKVIADQTRSQSTIPFGMNFRFFVALTLVSKNVGKAAENWLCAVDPDTKKRFYDERARLSKVREAKAITN